MTGTEVYDFYKDFSNHLENIGYHNRSIGSFRRAYIRHNNVIKVPHNLDGIIDNIMEAKAWGKYHNNPTSLGIYLAPCRLLPNYCLSMVKVAIWEGCSKDWADQIDGRQVGKYKDRVVAFDYALDLEERYDWEQNNLIKSDFFFHDYKFLKPNLFPRECYSDIDLEVLVSNFSNRDWCPIPKPRKI